MENFQYLINNANNNIGIIDQEDQQIYLQSEISIMRNGNNVLMPANSCLKDKKTKKFKRYGKYLHRSI
jgi:hypothetical protein